MPKVIFPIYVEDELYDKLDYVCKVLCISKSSFIRNSILKELARRSLLPPDQTKILLRCENETS
jgi:predicted transcriptional regulator